MLLARLLCLNPPKFDLLSGSLCMMLHDCELKALYTCYRSLSIEFFGHELYSAKKVFISLLILRLLLKGTALAYETAPL